MRRFPDARRFVAVCGGGANGGDGRIALEVLESAGRIVRAAEDAPVEEADVVIDALFGTGFHGEPRETRRGRSRRSTPLARRSSRSTCPRASTPRRGEVAGACVQATVTVTMHGAEGRHSRSRRDASARARSSSRTSGSTPARPSTGSSRRRSCARSRGAARSRTSTRAGTVLVVGGSRGLTGAPLPRRRGCLPRRRRLRGRRRARLDAGRLRAAPARGGEAALPRGRGDDLAARDRADRGVRREGGRARARARARPRRRTARARAAAADRARPPGSRRRRRAARARAVRAGGADRAHAARGRARRGCSASSRSGSPRTGSRPSAAPPSNFRCVCLLKGADTLVAAPGEGVLVVVARHARARDRRHAATCSPASSPPSSPRAWSRGRPPRRPRRRSSSPSRAIPQSGAVASDVVGRAAARARCTGLS